MCARRTHSAVGLKVVVVVCGGGGGGGGGGGQAACCRRRTSVLALCEVQRRDARRCLVPRWVVADERLDALLVFFRKVKRGGLVVLVCVAVLGTGNKAAWLGLVSVAPSHESASLAPRLAGATRMRTRTSEARRRVWGGAPRHFCAEPQQGARLAILTDHKEFVGALHGRCMYLTDWLGHERAGLRPDLPRDANKKKLCVGKAV